MIKLFVITGIAGFLPGLFTMLGERAAGSAVLAKILLPLGILALIDMCVLVIVEHYHWCFIPILIVEWVLASQIAAAIVGRR